MIFFYHAEIEDAAKIFAMAETIWHEHFDAILGKKQVDYMLNTFHTIDTIAQDINNGYNYYFIKEYDVGGIKDCGYTAYKSQEDKLYISKVYILKEYRGKGLFKRTFKDLYLHKAKRQGAKSIYLYVNRNNIGSIKAYESVGFKIVKPITEDIGGGYFKEDFLMELIIK